jgi:hypothetical protein
MMERRLSLQVSQQTKKETDGRILWQVLLHHHVKQLYLYAADVPGK